MNRVENFYKNINNGSDFRKNIISLIQELRLEDFNFTLIGDEIQINLKDNREEEYVKQLVLKHMGILP